MISIRVTVSTDNLYLCSRPGTRAEPVSLLTAQRVRELFVKEGVADLGAAAHFHVRGVSGGQRGGRVTLRRGAA
jgi:hypothetical protein